MVKCNNCPSKCRGLDAVRVLRRHHVRFHPGCVRRISVVSESVPTGAYTLPGRTLAFLGTKGSLLSPMSPFDDVQSLPETEVAAFSTTRSTETEPSMRMASPATIMSGSCAVTPGLALDSPFTVPWTEMDLPIEFEDVLSLAKTENATALPVAKGVKPEESCIIISSDSDEAYPPASQIPDRVKTPILVRGSSSEEYGCTYS